VDVGGLNHFRKQVRRSPRHASRRHA
jgi:hypothetical protein